MNNNYHTQLNKPNNVLLEVAANQNLLQQQMQNFHGTPIVKSSATQMENQQMQMPINPNIPTRQQQAYAQQQFTQPDQPQKQYNDEIELSDVKPDPAQELTKNKGNEVVNKQQINKQIQHLVQNPNNQDPIRPAHYKPITNVKSIPPVKPTKNRGYISYLIMAIILVVVFVILVHPKTSVCLNKYVPIADMKKTSGIFVRGIILAIIYLILAYLLTSKKS